MKQLFLTSAIGTPGVITSIRRHLGHNRNLKTAFITTPVEVEDMTDDSWYQADRSALANNGFYFFDYTITSKTAEQIGKDLADIEALYISGGNTNYLLQKSQNSGFAPFVRELIDRGTLYISTSAGSIITGPTLPPYLWDDQKKAPNLSDYTSYNLVNFTIIPHWGSPCFRKEYLGSRIEQIYQDPQSFLLLNDNQYVEVKDDEFRIIDVRNEK